MRSLGYLIVASFLALAPASASAWQVAIDGGAGGSDEVRAIAVDGDGNVLTAGYLSDPNTAGDSAVIKLDGESGAELWRQVFDGSAGGRGDLLQAIGVDSSGDVFVAGSWKMLDNWRIGVAKLSGATGEIVWQETLQDSLDEPKLAVFSSGDLVVVGRGATDYTSLYAAKLSGASGAELWRFIANGTQSGGSDRANSVAIDFGGDVIVGGSLQDVGSGGDVAVLKLSGLTGIQMWRYQTRGNKVTGSAAVNSVAVDSAGSILAVGYVDSEPQWLDMLVVKLGASTGAEVWRKEINGGEYNDWIHYANSVAIDAADDVAVVGALNHWRDFIALKFSAGAGAELWRDQIVGTVHYDGGEALAVAVDSYGNVAAAGYTSPAQNAQDFTVVKLSANGGAEQWRHSGDGTGHGDDRALAVATDQTGNVVSAGFKSNAGTGKDFTVIKLDGVTGSPFPCQDGFDNDSDGAADYPADPGCTSASDPSEIDPMPPCGNGIVGGTEECDDGAANSDVAPNACRSDCTLPICGDAVVDTGEQCDAGAANSDVTPNACRTSCMFAACGDGVVDSQESCDDGAANNDSSADACRTTCALASCGDGVVDAGEACDAGVANSDVAADACRTTCTPATCGDGVTDAGEQCDDDGVARFDGCNDTCALEGGFVCSGQPTTCSVVPSPQDKAQQKCIVAQNKSAAKLADAWSADAARCIRAAGAGKSESFGVPGTAQDCLTNDVMGRVEIARTSLGDKAYAACSVMPSQRPVYAYVESDAIVAGVRTQAIGLTADLFGPDLDSAIVSASTDKRGATCQSQLQKSAASIFKSSMQAFISCKSSALSGKARLTGQGPVESLMGLQDEVLACLDASADGSTGRIRKAAAKSRTVVVAKCGDPGVSTPIAELAPGCASADLSELMSCPERAAACRFCGTANSTDGLGINCDEYDDGAANLSCP